MGMGGGVVKAQVHEPQIHQEVAHELAKELQLHVDVEHELVANPPRACANSPGDGAWVADPPGDCAGAGAWAATLPGDGAGAGAWVAMCEILVVPQAEAPTQIEVSWCRAAATPCWCLEVPVVESAVEPAGP